MRVPSALDHLDDFAQIFAAPWVGLFTDFDGTLTPIVDDPREAKLAANVRDCLEALAEKLAMVTVVSGRRVEFLRDAVGLEGLTYVGNHGLAILRAGDAMTKSQGEALPGLLDDTEREIAELGLSGIFVEDKGSGVAVHYRNAPEPGLARPLILSMVRPLAEALGLRVKEGKMVVELTSSVEVSKGTAVEELAREAGLGGAVVLGDDVTDCDAFDSVHRLKEKEGLAGAAVAVVDGETPPEVMLKADYWLSGREEVEEFLRWMAYEAPRVERKP